MFALAIGCLSLLPIAAQQLKPAVEIRTAGGQTTFHMGERISIILSLTGPDNKKYGIDTASYDRSGRLTIDSFDATPATGWSDPLTQYFSRGFMMGGLRGSEQLSSKPVTFTADLNEQIRFDQPGTYTINATSHRVGTIHGENSFPREPFLSILSNAIQIHIIPATPEWQAEKLRSILAKPIQRSNSGRLDEERVAAIADLRFLNSPAAIEALAANLRDDSGNDGNGPMWSASLGLAGVPDSLRDVALHAMSRQLESPDFPVSSFFLSIMTGLEAGPNDGFKELEATQTARSKTVWQLAFSGLARKQGAARAATAETLLAEAEDEKIPGLTEQIAAIVASTFTALPIDRQVAQLQYNWDALRNQPMLRVLQALLHQTQKKNTDSFHSAADLHVIALQRWFELDSDGATRALVAQLASPNPSFPISSISTLPGGPQPQFEAKWAQEFLESEDDERQSLLAALMVRFGTGTATVQVESKLDSLVGNWACEPQAIALAYVVKFHSDNAASLVRRAMASTHDTACYQSLFSSISQYAYGPALNEAAIAALHNPDPRSAADAAEYLRFYGTESAKQPLLQRYREWNEMWAGKASEVDPSTESGYPRSTLGQNLGEALIANQGWLSDPALIAEVLRRCVGEQMCREVQQLASAAASPIPNVLLNPSANFERYDIGPYSSKSLNLFEAKLAQFPKETKFNLIPSYPRNDDQIKLERDAAALFKKHGMTLEFPVTPSATSAQ